jgi:two-component system chemotaxis sensor kinase CheA
VASAVDAVELLERGERFDAAVSELNLPMMNGMEFADWVRTHDSTIASMALIALTSGKATLFENDALAAGFHRFLAKFNAGQLISAIEDLCRNKRSGVVA